MNYLYTAKHVRMLRIARLFLLSLIIALLTHSSTEAQYAPNPAIEQDYTFFAGGNLGLGLGTITNVDISPYAGMFITEFWSMGLGPTYQFYQDKTYFYSNDAVRLNILGGRVFTRLYPANMLFAHLEYEFLSYKTNVVYYTGIDPDDRITSENLLVGLGYRQALGISSTAFFAVLWNLNETLYTPYRNPVYRTGIEFGFE